MVASHKVVRLPIPLLRRNETLFLGRPRLETGAG